MNSSGAASASSEPSGFTDESVADRLAAIRARIDGVARPFDHDVTVIAVTKGFDGRAIEAAFAAGCRTVGENYAQDLLSKDDTLRRLDPAIDGNVSGRSVDVQFIGQLQSNKVRQVAHLVTVWATVDRTSIVDEIAKRAPSARVLIQVNATGETNKGGCAPSEVPSLIDHARTRELQVCGLMTVGPTDRPPEAARPAFQTVRALVDTHRLEICSMGMTADLDVAVACGATEVRIGSALFGPRPSR